MSRTDKPMEVPALVKLRPWCGEEVSPGQWVYHGVGLDDGDGVRPVEELKALVDGRTLDELQEQAESAAKQLFARAHCGDEQAIQKLALLVRGSVGSLQTLAEQQPEKMKAEAELFPRWPVLLSLNPQDIKAAKKNLNVLGVGTKAPTPTRPGQRVDRHTNYWTQLAEKAYRACRMNRALVPCLLAHAKGSPKEREAAKFWGTKASADCFTLGNGDQILLTRWHTDCTRLPEPSPPMSEATFLEWWAAVDACLFEYWRSYPEKYAEALGKIGQPKLEEYHQRNLAVTQVRKRFRSLVGLRR